MIVEVRTFRPRAGVGEDQLRAVEAGVYALAMRRPGMTRRTTAVAADGEWAVVQLWHDLAAAEAGDDVGADLEALAEPGSLTVRRYADLGG